MAIAPVRISYLQESQPIIADQSGRPAPWFIRALNNVFKALVDAVNGVISAQNAADAAQTTADGAVDDAAAANANANSRQPASTSLTALALLNGMGLVEQTGTNAFTDRAIGVAAGTSIPTRADADGRYVRRDQTSAPGYSPYPGQTVSNPPTQAEVQALDNAVVALAVAVAAINSKLQTIHAFT